MNSKTLAAACMLAAAASPALAHHSYQMFDTTKTITYTGTLKSFEWTNPHMWFQVVVDQPGKSAAEFGFEAGAPTMYSTTGWRKKNIPIGDKVTVTANPLRNGDTGGSLVKIVFSNGAVLGRGGTSPDGKAVAFHGGPP